MVDPTLMDNLFDLWSEASSHPFVFYECCGPVLRQLGVSHHHSTTLVDGPPLLCNSPRCPRVASVEVITQGEDDVFPHDFQTFYVCEPCAHFRSHRSFPIMGYRYVVFSQCGVSARVPESRSLPPSFVALREGASLVSKVIFDANRLVHCPPDERLTDRFASNLVSLLVSCRPRDRHLTRRRPLNRQPFSRLPPGLCYLAFFKRADWRGAIAALGHFPSVKAVARHITDFCDSCVPFTSIFVSGRGYLIHAKPVDFASPSASASSLSRALFVRHFLATRVNAFVGAVLTDDHVGHAATLANEKCAGYMTLDHFNMVSKAATDAVFDEDIETFGFCYLGMFKPQYHYDAYKALGYRPQKVDILNFILSARVSDLPDSEAPGEILAKRVTLSPSPVCPDIWRVSSFPLDLGGNQHANSILSFLGLRPQRFGIPHKVDHTIVCGLTMSPLDNAISTLTDSRNRGALEGRILDDVQVTLTRQRELCPFALPEPVQPYAEAFGIPFSGTATTSHSHPVHAAYRRLLHLVKIPPLLVQPSTVFFLKRRMFDDMKRCCKVVGSSTDHKLSNVVVTPRDLARYDADSLGANPRVIPPCSTALGFVSEAGQFFSPYDVSRFFDLSPAMTTCYFSTIIPPEALVYDRSIHPDLYQFSVKDGKMLYYPEQDRQLPYEQPASCVWWLKTNKLYTPNATLFIEKVISDGPFHTFLVTSIPLSVPTHSMFHDLVYIPIPSTHRNSVHKNFPIPVALLRSLVLYAFSLNKLTERDLMAKLRQHRGILESSQIPLPVCLHLVKVVMRIVTTGIVDTSDTRFYDSVFAYLKYKTWGSLKRVTAGKVHERWLKRFNSSFDDSACLKPIMLNSIRVNDGPPNAIFGDIRAMDQDSRTWWRRFLEGPLCLRKVPFGPTKYDADNDEFVMVLSHQPFRWHDGDGDYSESAGDAIRQVVSGGVPSPPRPTPTWPNGVNALGRANQIIQEASALSDQVELATTLGKKLVVDEAFESELKILERKVSLLLRGDGQDVQSVKSSSVSTDLSLQETRAPGAPCFVGSVDLARTPDDFSVGVTSAGTSRDDTFDCSDWRTMPLSIDDNGVDYRPWEIEDRRHYTYHVPPPILFEGYDPRPDPPKRAFDTRHCKIPNCAWHTGDLTRTCLSGFPTRTPQGQPCHACPVPEGGALVRRAPGGAHFVYFARSERVIPRHYAVSEFLDRLFPKTVGKRHNDKFAGKVLSVKMVNPLTKNHCLLKAISGITGVNLDTLWRLIHELCPVGHSSQLLLRDQPLNLKHLEVLCLYFGLNVTLRGGGDVLKGWPTLYGIEEGVNFVIDFYPSGGVDDLMHFEYHPQKQREFRKAREWKDIRVKHDKPWGARHLINECTRQGHGGFVDYTPSQPRAEAYVRAMRFGTTGTLLAVNNEEFMEKMETEVNFALKNPRKRVRIMVVMGDPGCGKSYPYQQLLANPFYHRDHLFQVVVPTTALRAEWSAALDMRSKKPLTDKGTPSEFCATFETALFSDSHVVVVDEAAKMPPGYIDTLIAMKGSLTHVIILTDCQQTVWHEPKQCELNNKNDWRPEADHFAEYCKTYLVGTRRLSYKVAKFLNLPTTSKDRTSGFCNRQTIEPGTTVIVPSANNVNDLAALGGHTAITINSSQGATYSSATILINRTVLLYADFRALWTALTRSKGRVYIVWDVTPDPATLARIHENPVLAELWRYRDAPDDWTASTNLDPVSLANPHNVLVRDKRKLICAKEEFTFFPHHIRPVEGGLVPRSRVVEGWRRRVVPSGGAYVEELFGDEAHDSKAFYSQVRPCEPASVGVPLASVLEPMQRVHFPKASIDEMFEFANANVPERFEQELYDDRISPDGNWSTQKRDLPVRRRDQVAQAQKLRQFRDKQGLRGQELEDAMAPYVFSDMRALAPFHQMSARDRVAFRAGVKKRITRASPAQNLAEFDAAHDFLGPALFTSLCDYFPALRRRRAFDSQLFTACQEDNEANRVRVKSARELRNARARAQPEWDPFFADLAAKTELKAKGETMFANAKPLQTLVTMHDEVFHTLGPVARYITHFITNNLPSNIYLHLQTSPADLDAFVKAKWKDVLSSQNDFTAYDQGQDAPFLYMEVKIMEALSIPPNLIQYYIRLKTHLKLRVGNAAIMRFTGEVFTFLFNTLANMAITNLRFAVGDSVICFAGDDMSVNGVLVERPSWPLISRFFTLEFKYETTRDPTFCSWRLTSRGIFKDPLLLYMRLKARVAQGLFKEVALSYLYEFSFGYRMGDSLAAYLPERYAYAHSLLVSFFLRRRGLPLEMLSRGMDSPGASDPAFYSAAADRLASALDKKKGHTQDELALIESAFQEFMKPVDIYPMSEPLQTASEEATDEFVHPSTYLYIPYAGDGS